MKPFNYIPLMFLLLMVSCVDYLEIDSPKNQMVGDYIFAEKGTVESALAHIYAGFREIGPTKGSISGLSNLMGHYADELEHLSESQTTVRDFFTNSVLPTNSEIEGIWNNSYTLIYQGNRILEGVSKSADFDKHDKDQYLGEAYFIRALVHFYLTNLFGDIPYINSTDYRINNTISKVERAVLLDSLLSDVAKARELLSIGSNTESQFRPDKWTASALMARIYLEQGDWEKALSLAIKIIDDGPFYLESDLSLVFKKTSSETIWQLDSGSPESNTHQGRIFVALSYPPENTALTESLVNAFEPGDMRFRHWVGNISDGVNTYYFPYKYREYGPTEPKEECSIIFRLSEVYLIAAEAEVRLGLLDAGRNHLNALRERASLSSLAKTDQAGLLDAVLHERRVELFSEHGHRYFDLKRMKMVNSVLSVSKPFWDETDILLPLPENELLKNPNLMPQNEGY